MATHTKKILFTSHTANFSKFNRPFMRLLKNKDYEVHYASAGEETVIDCDKHFTVPFSRSPFSLRNIRAFKQLKKIIDAEKYDIIHTHTPMGSVVTRLAAKNSRKQNDTSVIYTAHGFHFFKGAPLLNWLTYYPIEKLMSRYTDTLVTINNEDYLRAKKHFNSKSIHKISGVGVDFGTYKFITAAKKQVLRAKYNYKKDDFILLCIAEFTKNKNQKFLINTFTTLLATHPNMKIIFAGSGDELDACKMLRDKLGLPQGSVQFLGYRKDVDKLYALSDILVSASHREGLPVNIIEAMASGLPVVCTDIRGCNDLVKEKRNGYLYSVNDKKTFISAINTLYTDQSIRRAVSQNNVRDTREYSVINAIKNMQDIYEGSKRPTPAEPIRILQIVTIMNRAGLETMLMNYYRNIDRSKVQFDFLVHRSEKGDYDDEIVNLGGRIYYSSPIGLKTIGTYHKRLKKFFLEHSEYQTIHVHLDSLSALPLSAAKSALIPTRIAHSHTNSFDKNAKYFVRIITKQFIKCYATDFIGCSLEAATFMFGKNTRPHQVVNNAIDTEHFTYSIKKRNAVRNELNIKNNFVVGHVGRFNYPKNHEFLIDVFKEIHKKNSLAVLLLVGSGENETNIKKQVVDLHLEKSVRFLGLRSDISGLMQAMDVFVMPSRYEGLPVVSIEAQASGLPCFFSDVITKKLDVTGNCQFVSLGTKPEKWADIISKAADHKRVDMRTKIAKNSYDAKIEAHKLQDFYVRKNI